MFVEHVTPEFGPLYDLLDQPFRPESMDQRTMERFRDVAGVYDALASDPEWMRQADDAYEERRLSVAGGLCLILVGDHGSLLPRRNDRISRGYISDVETYLKRRIGADRVHRTTATANILALALADEHVTSMVMVGHGSYESFTCAEQTSFGWWTTLTVPRTTRKTGFVMGLHCGSALFSPDSAGCMPLGHYMAADRQRVLGFRRRVTTRMIEQPATFLEGIDLEYMHNNTLVDETNRLRRG